MRVTLRVFASMCLVGTLALSTPTASADAPPQPPGSMGHPYYELRAGANQVAMVPLGEIDLLGWHLRVTTNVGVLGAVKYHAACGPTLLSGPMAERIPTFSPSPSALGPGRSAVCGEVGCTCPHAAGKIHVDRPPRSLPASAPDALEASGPILPNGAPPLPVADDGLPGCFGWLELALDATGLEVGRQILATVDAWAPDAPLDGPPTSSRKIAAAVITP